MQVKVIENVLKLNDEVAQLNRAHLKERGITCVNIMGSPGCGKTRLLERTLELMHEDIRIGVLTGDLCTTRDAERLAKFTPHVAQINTGKSCHLDANQVRQGMESIDLDAIELLIIENVGNLICPVGFDLGQDAKVGIFSVTEGDDKPAKHPYIVLEAAFLILNKIDLISHFPFDLELFHHDVKSLREDVPLVELSAHTGDGIRKWTDWLSGLIGSKNTKPTLERAPA